MRNLSDDLDAIGAELFALVTEMREETAWVGIADPGTCRYCRYRSICPASAAPGLPAWPRIDDDPDAFLACCGDPELSAELIRFWQSIV